jgi:hypothetical protein
MSSQDEVHLTFRDTFEPRLLYPMRLSNRLECIVIFNSFDRALLLMAVLTYSETAILVQPLY